MTSGYEKELRYCGKCHAMTNHVRQPARSEEFLKYLKEDVAYSEGAITYDGTHANTDEIIEKYLATHKDEAVQKLRDRIVDLEQSLNAWREGEYARQEIKKGLENKITDLEEKLKASYNSQRMARLKEAYEKIKQLEKQVQVQKGAHEIVRQRDKKIASLELQLLEERREEHLICPTCKIRICEHGDKHGKQEPLMCQSKFCLHMFPATIHVCKSCFRVGNQTIADIASIYADQCKRLIVAAREDEISKAKEEAKKHFERKELVRQ